MQHNCPRCQQSIAPERLQTAPFICDHCGYALSKPAGVPEHTVEKSDARIYVGIAGAILGLFIFASSSVELRWLQARNFVGLSSMASLERLEQLCGEAHSPSCVEQALAGQSARDPRRSIKQAEYLMLRMKYKEAAQSMKKYIASGKADSRSLTIYGRALAESGRLEEASRIFERMMPTSRRGDFLPAQTYVKYLTRAKRFDQALSVILRLRRFSPNALPLEYRVISEMRGAAANRMVAGKR